MPPRRPRTGRASSTPRCIGVLATKPAESPWLRHSPRHNWIWLSAGQMWYMQPCLPAPKARRSWRALIALGASGPVRPEDRKKSNRADGAEYWDWNGRNDGKVWRKEAEREFRQDAVAE